MRHSIPLSCLFFSGCVFSTDYPSNWPEPLEILEIEACPDISGRYENNGLVASADDDQISEAYLGIDLFRAFAETVDTVAISQTSDRIGGLGYWTDSDDVAGPAFLYRGEDYECREGRLWLSHAGWADPDGGLGTVIAKEWASVGFTKTDDGSLMAEAHSSGAGVFVLIIVPIPIAGKATDYALWRPVTSE